MAVSTPPARPVDRTPATSNPHHRWVVGFWGYIAILLAISLSAYMGWLRIQALQIPYLDTAMHFFLLGIASYLSHRALRGRRVPIGTLRIPLGPLLVGACAMADELLQMYFPSRTFSLLDMSANLSGIILFGWMASAGHCTSKE
jgi:polysaccharide biosynthesis protein VpsQ